MSAKQRSKEVQMERSSGTKKGLRMAAVSLFLFAALLSTGCGQNALMNPSFDSAQGDTIASPAGNDVKPAGNDVKPAGNDVKP
jgi:hypothetical protein